MKRIKFIGKGGEGVQFAAKLFAKTMVNNGWNATLISIYGPEARGSSSICSVIVDTEEIVTPICNEWDILVAFNNEDFENNKEGIETLFFIANPKSNVEYATQLLDYFKVSPKLAIPTLKTMISEKHKDKLDEGIKILNQ